MTEDDLRKDWKLGTVTRAVDYCHCCEQQTRCGLISFDDSTMDTLHAKHMHRDGSFTTLFVVGARVAQMKGGQGVSIVDVLLGNKRPKP